MRKVLLSIALLFWATIGSAGPVTVAALGDSLVHGFGLPEQEGFVPQLQAALRAQGHDVALINAGVSGDTTAGGAARIDWTLTPEVDALIIVLGGNDMLRGIDPANARTNIETILSRATDTGVEVLLVGMRAPGNYGPDYKREFDALYPELAEEFGALLYPHFFAAFDDVEQTAQAMRTYMQPDGIHPNAQGVARIVKDMLPSAETLVTQAAGS
ncbi:MAG: arylesterase [Paracoccaceae bacterium]